MWFNKEYEDAVYIDLRSEVKPDIVCSTEKLPFKDNVFNLIVFDPPHTNMSGNLAKDYGKFTTREIRFLVIWGSRECFRVLKKGCFMIFKWNTHDIMLQKALSMIHSEFKILFGHKTAYKTKHSSQTYWFTCVKNE
jgi:hypothetical protein